MVGRRRVGRNDRKGPPSFCHPGDMSGAVRRPWFSGALLSLKEAGLHLACLDESDNAGTYLNDPEQPIFLLAALIVPKAAWEPLERDLEQAITRHIPTMAIGHVARGTGNSAGMVQAEVTAPGGQDRGLSQMRRTGADSFTSGRNGSKRVATHVLR